MYAHCVLFHALRAAISLFVHCMYMGLYMYFQLLIESVTVAVWKLWLLVNFSSDNEFVPLIGFDVL